MSSAKHDVETLMNEFVEFAEQMLGQYGEFAPYGAALKPDGEMISVSGYDEDEQAVPDNLIELLTDGFAAAARAGTYRATALFYNATVELPDGGAPQTVVACALDHADNYSVIVLLPYDVVDGDVTFGEALAQEGERRIFGQVH